MRHRPVCRSRFCLDIARSPALPQPSPALTSPGTADTIIVVNTRFLIPVSIFAFGVFITVISWYASSEDEPAARMPVRPRAAAGPPVSHDTRQPSPISPSSPLARPPSAPPPGQPAAAPARTSVRNRLDQVREPRVGAKRTGPRAKPSRPAPRPTWTDRLRLAAALADRLDDAVSRLRSNLLSHTFAQLFVASHDAQTGQIDAAVLRLDRILARSPEDAAAQSAKAAALVAAGQYEQAADLYAAVVLQAPQDAAARYNFGVLLCRQARLTEATEQFRRLVAIDPNHARGWYNLATLCQRAGRLAEARDAWETFVELQPNAAAGYFNLGIVWMDFDEPLQAAWCFKRVTMLTPDAPDAWLNLGLAYAAADHPYPALEALTAAADRMPCDPTVLRGLADLHERLAADGGPGAATHRRLAASLKAKAE